MALTNAQKLTQARDALHQLMVGKKKVTVRYGETTVTYNQASINELRQYIAELEQLEGEVPATTRGGPFGVAW